MAAYNVKIGDVELTQEIKKVEFSSSIPDTSKVRSSNIDSTITITGRISYDAEDQFMRDALKEIAVWSLVKPESTDAYKEATVEYIHTGAPRKYTFSHAFVVSFREQYGDEDGDFELVVRQKTDKTESVTIE